MTTSTATPRLPRVLVNIPILNEIEIIDKLLARVTAALRGYDFLVLIVDDGSTDGTLERVQAAVAANPAHVGLLHRRKTRIGCQRGAALLAGLKWGVEHGGFDVYVEMDGDLSHLPEDMPSGIDAVLSGAGDVVIASKYVPGSVTTGRSFGRTAVSVICNIAVRAVIDRRLRDFSNGFRFYSRVAAELIPQYEIRYGSPIYLSEAMAIWMTHGLRVVEIPGHYVGRAEGLSKVRLNDYIKAAIGVLEIGWRYRVTGFTKLSQIVSEPDDHALEAAGLMPRRRHDD
jgi:dolichol-phosphate mannosyltransferase